ncbi:type II secretion system F family protein [Phycisphaera mikurensis]|uniref:Type IV pilus assembly protein PilC n=1 Tax=Phycisphaera mikurensis (strain NBRC 102666 / KCTC 22515 / FYK2301M01) TaxID=1142394 RepID=I0IFZ4_PHYMF|nr:type II secretion system F family protein [Phycisphaera mikurensis]MBB6440432.1 type IV pilus assembly protein PilC [Phycisphaera mikurensis]BAM04182.1 type IV pilus assembly protein PilC [Phycisphaera mikurensis NBRC 102666]
MPTYAFQALNDAGKPQKGTINAADADEAAARIKSQGFFPTEIREQKSKKGKKGGGGGGEPGAKKKKGGLGSISIGGVKQKQLTVFTRQMSTLQDAGLPILRSLSILEQQQKPGPLKSALEEIHEDVSAGSALSDAMSRHPKAFNKLYVKMIAAGEVGGVLDLILQRLSEFMEKAAKLKARIISAMIYPAAVISVAGVIVLGIMLLIVPKFIEIFNDFGTELPALTTFLIESAKWLAGPLLPEDQRGTMPIPGVILLLFVPFLIFFAFKFIRKTTIGKNVTDRVLLMIPVAGQLIRKSTIAKFTRTLGTLVNAGVPILDAITITSETTGNAMYSNALMAVHGSVRQGDSFAEPLRKAKVCDPIVVNMIDVGEETGDLDKMLLKIADNYDEEVDVAVAGLVSLLEPIMVVVLGGIVGFIVVALFLPLVKLMSSLM